ARYFVGGGLDVSAPGNLEKRQIDENALDAFSSKTRPIRSSNAGRTKRVRDVPIPSWFGSLLSAPISLLGETVGWLYLVDKLGAPEFSEADERLALTLAGQLAV